MALRMRNLLVALLLCTAGPALSEPVRELGTAELRQIVRSGGIMSLKSAVAAVAASTAAEPIEARAFLADGVIYRMVFKRPDGTLFSVILDARTGRSVPAGSSVGKQVAQAAEARSGKKSTKSTPESRTTGGGKGGGSGASGGNGGSGGSGGSSGGKGGGGGGRS